MENGRSWCWRPEGSGQAASGQPSSLTTSLVAPSSGLLVVAIEGTSPHATTTGSRTGVDLEVVFLISLQSTLLEAYTRFLGLLKTRIAMIRRYSSMDKRPGYGYEVMMRMLVLMMTWYQDKVRRSRIEIMWVDHVSGHVLRSPTNHINSYLNVFSLPFLKTLDFFQPTHFVFFHYLYHRVSSIFIYELEEHFAIISIHNLSTC